MKKIITLIGGRGSPCLAVNYICLIIVVMCNHALRERHMLRCAAKVVEGLETPDLLPEFAPDQLSVPQMYRVRWEIICRFMRK